MTNKELVNFECERLENIRQELINLIEKKYKVRVGECIRELGEIEYELTEKIHD